jgi:hypothetical protein
LAWSHQPAKRRSIFASHCTVSASSDISSNADATGAATADSTIVTVFGVVTFVVTAAGVVTFVVTAAVSAAGAAVTLVVTVAGTEGVVTAAVVTAAAAGAGTEGVVVTAGAVVTAGVITAGAVVIADAAGAGTEGAVVTAGAAVVVLFAFGFVSEEVIAGAVGGAAGFEVAVEDILLYRQ